VLGIQNEDKSGNTGKQKSERRQNGSGSIYPLKDNKGYGMCIQLGGTVEMKKLYGNKLRIVQTAKTLEQIKQKLAEAVENRADLLENKLVKLGWYDRSSV
jgi:hypothetical protein